MLYVHLQSRTRDNLDSLKQLQRSRKKQMPKTALLLIKFFCRCAQNQWLLMGSPQRGAMGIKKPGDIKGKRPGAYQNVFLGFVSAIIAVPGVTVNLLA